MSCKGQHVQDSSVVERRLRPIYDWLDFGNNKKALQECDKVLKKTPNLHCAKALKALTLHRMGRENESIQVLEKLVEEQPIDDATLQAMTLCYRELHQLEKICKIYVTALKLDNNNEELYTHLFMSYVRVFDYKSQQQTAMALYKFKPKNPYYCWAVMSLILQATKGDGRNDSKTRDLLLSLSERMMCKLLNDNKIDAEQELQLYIMILELKEKYLEILKLLDSEIGKKLIGSDTNLLQLNYLKKLEKWSEINLICKNMLIDNVDKWDIWKTYLNSVMKLIIKKQLLLNNHTNSSSGNSSETSNVTDEDNQLNLIKITKSSEQEQPELTVDDTVEKCHEFICSLIENNGSNRSNNRNNIRTNNYSLRGPYLARIELCSNLTKHNFNTIDLLGDTIELFIEYFRKFGHKPCCVTDLKLYLNLLNSDKKSELSTRLIKDVGISATSVPQSEEQLQRHLCALQIYRLCGNHRNLSNEHLKALVTAFTLHYQHGYQTYGLNTLPTNLGLSDPYIILAVHVLYDLSIIDKNNRTEMILIALILLENLLKNSPSNFHAKLLAIRLYHTIGGGLGAQQMYNSLDCKHLQLDSLGFIHCACLPTTGLFSLCTDLYDVTLKFFSSNYKDSSDHLTFSYKYGSFIKIDEFMDFRERLNNSLHYATVSVGRIFLNLIECSNLDTLYNLIISPKDGQIDFDLLRDNNDYSVYINWDPESILGQLENSEEIRKYFNENKLFLKLRIKFLIILSTIIKLIKSIDGIRKKLIIELETNLNDFNTLLLKNDLNSFESKRIVVPLKSRLINFIKNPNLNLLNLLIKFLINTITINESDKNMEMIHKEIDDILNESIEFFKNRLINDGINDLERRRESMEFIVNSVEILCISCLICLLSNDLIKSTSSLSPPASTATATTKTSQGNKKNKKKLNELPKSKELLNKIVNSIKLHFDLFCNLIDNWVNKCKLNDITNFLEQLNLNNNINNERNVYDNIINSYLLATKEIQTILKNKIKMLNNIVC